MNTIPILLLTFNRLDSLIELFKVLSVLKPQKIYVASDGARESHPGEDAAVTQVREYVLGQIDWECDVNTLFRDGNLGCKLAVHGALQWFFLQEDNGIVLEDDIVPSLSFFMFCEKALEYFKDDMRVGSITGRNELGEFGGGDIFSASRFQCWGWASWSDRILNMDVDYGYDIHIDYSNLYENAMWEERCYIDSVLGLLQTRQVNSWAYAYDLNFKRNNQLQIYPRFNMVKNIGFGDSGTHSSSRLSDCVPFYENFSPSDNYIQQFKLADNKSYIRCKLRAEYGGLIKLFVMRYVRYLKWLKRLKKRLKRIH